MQLIWKKHANCDKENSSFGFKNFTQKVIAVDGSLLKL